MNLQKQVLAAAGAVLLFVLGGASAHAQSFFEGFNNPTLPANWVAINNSTRNSTGNPWATGTAIVDADSNPVVVPYEGAEFAIANYTSVGSGTGTISNWLISPMLSLNNGDTFSFFTTTVPASGFPDRLELRLSLAGASTNVGTTATSVGDFTTVLLTINSALAVGGYPESWTQFTATISGLGAPTSGRFALRYFVTSGGPSGANSNIIGIDAVQYSAVPEPSTFALLGGVALVGLAFSLRRRLKA
jgi:hypothetical protein